MRKKLIAVLAALAVGAGTGMAGAEQAAADTYRQIFRSGEFCLEYKDEYGVRIIGEKDGKRMERTKYEMSAATFLNPLGALFGGSGPKFPQVLHKDGKYYQFTEKGKATVCEDSRLDEENLDPRLGWSSIAQRLALPAELAVFCWDDPYRAKAAALEKPQATWSGKKTVDKVEYDCDRYASRLKAASGEESYYVYEMLYEGGVLKKIQSYVKRGEEEYPVNVLEIKKIEGTLPAGTFEIAKSAKIYAAGMGDMNDLLEQPVEVGTMEEL